MPDQIVTAVKDIWALVGTFVAAVLWFGRLEWRSRQTGRELQAEAALRGREDERERLAREREIAALEARLIRQRDEDLELRRQEWGQVNRRLDEMARDIKALLQRGT